MDPEGEIILTCAPRWAHPTPSNMQVDMENTSCPVTDLKTTLNCQSKNDKNICGKKFMILVQIYRFFCCSLVKSRFVLIEKTAPSSFRLVMT